MSSESPSAGGLSMPLGRWFLLWMLVVTVSTLGLAVGVVALRQWALLQDQLVQRADGVARTVGRVASEPIAGPLALAALPECVSITVADDAGALLWSFGPEPGKALEVDRSLLVVERVVTAAETPDSSPVNVTLLLAVSGIRAQVLDTGARLALTLGAALCAALLAGVLLLNRVVAPLVDLARYTRSFRPDEPPEIAVQARGATEVMELAAAFSELAGRLAQQRQQTFDEMSDGVAVIDDAGTPVLVNRAIRDDVDHVIPTLAGFDREVPRLDWTLSVGDRTLRCVLTRPEGMVNRILVVRDITEWVVTEERLREAQKMEAVATLAGGVAHDFNNLLAGILLHVRLIERDPQSGAEAGEAIRELAEEGAEVVQGLLRFAHPEATPSEALDLVELVAEQEQLLKHMLPARILLDLEGAETPLIIHGSASELRRVILNLVLNARNALGDSGGRVVIATRKDGDSAVLEVSDSGPGVAPELRERIFEPFFSLNREARGAGIGLAVVYAVVREHGGEITVDAGDEGGARFVMRFPLSGGRVDS